MKRLLGFMTIAFIPVVLLSALYPEKVTEVPKMEERYDSVAGSDLVVFVRDGCPHCAAFEAYAIEHNLDVEYHEVSQIDAQKLFSQLQERAPALNQGVPTIVLNGHVSQGYDTDEDGDALAARLAACQASTSGCLSFEEFVQSTKTVSVDAVGETCDEDCDADLEKYTLNLWFVGETDLTLLSLPTLSILLGFLDGFNPCAMWVLITLLTLLINTHDMKKVWVIGGTFLFVSGAIYYLFIAAWLNVFLLIGYNFWVQKVIGIVAIGGGGFYLYEAFGKDPNECSVRDLSARQRTIAKMKHILEISAWPAMILGVSILAISVNMIELVCTAGLPAIFTQILAFNDITDLARYWYIFIYIILYMIDDMVIFGIAVYTLHATGMTTKYRRFTMIFGGVLMYSLGILLIFAPNALMF
ncbi:MAG: glutaredoxin [Candidatus Peregrinibacteria bacterium]|nr:glutaredoxin [Candidatus Peregrinibacteria bacterium]MCB9808202.1 glutaredoxin [Candidatus Peribacteria bacterium]